jgi:hypothetical protein
VIPVATVHVEKMGSNDLFIFQVIPPPYWVGIVLLVVALVLMIPRLNEKYFKIIFLLATILLVISFRFVFPVVFTTIPAYEPDVIDYMKIVSSWVNSGVDFGVEGNYQHNYPLSFLFAFIFIKLGVPIDTFYRFAPFVIYGLNLLFLFLLVEAVMPKDKKKTALPYLSAFLLSFSSLGYWITVHYCPDLLGSLMFFVSLFFAIRFVKSDSWNLKYLLPVVVSIFLLILTHHLSILYLIVTLLGLSLSFWFFKPQEFKKGALALFILAIYSYTMWFLYGTLVYPSFFNVYVYFSGFPSVTAQSASAGLFTNIAFAVYPLFIIGLFVIEFARVLQIRNPMVLLKDLKAKIAEIRVAHSSNMLLIFTIGFSLVFGLFLVGFGVPVLFGSRILEVLCVGLYPLASQTLFNYANGNSRKQTIILVLVILVVITGIYRYYSQIQRRIILVL